MLPSARLTGIAALATALLLAAANQCFALQLIKDVSRDEAKKLGVVIRFSPAGEAGTRASLDFEPKGDLKNFLRVEVAIRAGEKCLVSAPLLTSNPTPERVSVSFSTHAENLPRTVLKIVARQSERTTIGYQFALKNFIEPHVAGPLTFALWSKDASLQRESDKDILAVKIGWPGPPARGTGDPVFEPLATTAVPAGVHPVARFEFPHRDATRPPIELQVVMDKRC
jgi:hypothetical protein